MSPSNSSPASPTKGYRPRWTAHEDDRLVELFKDDLTFKQIADQLSGRTPGGCLQRLNWIMPGKGDERFEHVRVVGKAADSAGQDA